MQASYGAGGEWLPQLDIRPPDRQRRLTVLLRILLLIPQYIVVFVLGIATFFVAIAGWFAALVTGRLPDWAADYLTSYLGYETRVAASEYLLVDRYPPFSFSAPEYPVQVEVRPGELNRLAVLARILLIIPAAIIYAVITAGWGAASFFIWLIVLIVGRMPEPLYEASAAVLRYVMRAEAYWLMLTSAYPKRLFGDGNLDEPAGARASGTKPLLMTTAGRVILAALIVIGIASVVSSGVTSSSSDQNSNTATVVTR
jgi:Domain of unknown function (DUF4389)